MILGGGVPFFVSFIERISHIPLRLILSGFHPQVGMAGPINVLLYITGSFILADWLQICGGLPGSLFY